MGAAESTAGFARTSPGGGCFEWAGAGVCVCVEGRGGVSWSRGFNMQRVVVCETVLMGDR